jgi:glucan phosphoethanolaminetransferase (alkaline phosphatase superfamily)
MSTAWLRFAYVCEFLLAVLAIFTLWSQVGGQGHLDLMAWYWKLVLGGGGSVAVVCLTAALMRQERGVSRSVVLWAVVIVVLAAAMAAVTFYYHVHEVIDEPDEEGATALCAGQRGTLT